LAENAQEFIFVHIPKKNMGDNPLRQKKNGRITFFPKYYAYDMVVFQNI
jgi:hypothetical protein